MGRSAWSGYKRCAYSYASTGNQDAGVGDLRSELRCERIVDDRRASGRRTGRFMSMILAMLSNCNSLQTSRRASSDSESVRRFRVRGCYALLWTALVKFES